jgi:hypothetical protein
MTFLDNIDWFQLREQARTLDKLINRNAQGDEVSKNLEALESLIYSVQAYGVNVLGLPERLVYGSLTRPSAKLCRSVKCPALKTDCGPCTGTRCIDMDKIPGNMVECPRGLL